MTPYTRFLGTTSLPSKSWHNLCYKKLYAEKYNTEIVSYCDSVDNGGFISAASLKMKDSMKITVAGNEERILLVALYDNLGKGASGAAIECMNIALGEEKTRALDI